MSVKPDASASRTTPIVFVVHDDVLVRDALARLILAQQWQPRTFATAGEFLTHPRVVAPCCLLLDVTLPDLSGLDLQKRVSDRSEMPLIFITAETDVQTTVRAMKGGALELFTKPFHYEALLSAIRFALDRSHAALRNEAVKHALQESYASLSHREREVMKLVVSGWLNKQIAAALALSEITVKAHRSKMVRKMKAASLPDLVNMAATLGLTTVPRAGGSLCSAYAGYAAGRIRSTGLSRSTATANA
jgi:FixJ family two-component response regulator